MMEYELDGGRSQHSNVTIKAPLSSSVTATTETIIWPNTHLVRADGWQEVIDPGRWTVKHCFGDPARERFASKPQHPHRTTSIKVSLTRARRHRRGEHGQ